MLTRTFLLLWLPVFILSCNRTKEAPKDFAALTEDEKRLPENALASMHVAPGLDVQLFAAEPMVTNPTNMSVDHLGRVWVCEAFNYDVAPDEADPKGDRIVVLEDTDGDGTADKRTVFYQGNDITTPLGIFVSGNTVYVSRSPNVLVFRDLDHDLVADTRDTLFTNLGPEGDHSAHSIFPGPEGKLYFSTGNMAGEIRDKKGNAVVDRAGFTVTQKGNPYLGGMVLRFDTTGQNVEVLGHNFRNNYGPCVDSFGNLWQSDNDDDGNESCRINFIMPYGNYGYLDEMTRASWMTNRVGIEKNISEQHWHQNDPGVVPNVLVTGAGSPAGMVFNEGDGLTEDFSSAPIHAEPYYNVVRAYIPSMDGSGFKAEIRDILKSDDQWFRPVDVSIAPDGSLFVADWYDPILGGGAAGDAGQGRIYRVAKNIDRYEVPRTSFISLDDNIQALRSPNPETRFIALVNLRRAGAKAEETLRKIWRSEANIMKARVMWPLAELHPEFLAEALGDSDPMIRVAAIRAALQLSDNPVPLLQALVNDPHHHVRRELVTSLRYSNTKAGADLWVKAAEQYDGNDRWFLEALGIGSDLHAALYFDTWLDQVTFDQERKAHRDLVWRIRSPLTLPLLAGIIKETEDAGEIERYFRAFDFHNDPRKNEILASLLELPRKDGKRIAALALQQMDAQKITRTPSITRALNEALSNTSGTIAFIDLVAKFRMTDRKMELISMATNDPGSPEANAAVNQLIRFEEFDLLRAQLGGDNQSAIALLKSLEGKGDHAVLVIVSGVAADDERHFTVRQAALRTLGSSWPGEEKLLELVKKTDFPGELKPLAASILFNVYRSSIQREAAKILPAPAARGSELPPVKELIASSGNLENGRNIFVLYCQSCHRIRAEGVRFGPELTQIGSKLSKDGLYRSIMFPDEGLSHGYESTLITMKDGSQVIGIVVNETDAIIELSQPGGSVNKYSMSQIRSREVSDRSLMPDLTATMSRQELVDLVTYLATLKN